MTQKHILLIDIGNTNTIIGISKNDTLLNNIISYRFSTNKNITIDDFGININFILSNLNIKKTEIKLSIISSVVPEINQNIHNSIKKYINSNIIFINGSNVKKLKLLKLNYKNPNEIGADRIINSIAAIHLYNYPSIIIDIGTATTIDIINNKKELICGAILPGIKISADILSKMTSQLPKIDIQKTNKFIGENTIESINIGIYHSFIGTIKYFCENLKKNKNLKNSKIILTGGFTELYDNHSEIFDYFDKDLIMKGLKIFSQNI